MPEMFAMHKMMGLRRKNCIEKCHAEYGERERKMLPPMRKYVHNENIHSTWEHTRERRTIGAATTHIFLRAIFLHRIHSRHPHVSQRFVLLLPFWRISPSTTGSGTYSSSATAFSRLQLSSSTSTANDDDDDSRNARHICVDLHSSPSSSDTRFHPFRLCVRVCVFFLLILYT